MKTKSAFVGVLLTLLIGTAVSTPAAAAGYYQEAPPENALQFRLGGFFPRGGGDVWDENEEVFTLDMSDFNDAIFGFTFLKGVGEHMEIGMNADFYDSTVVSSYESFVDDFGYPIAHDTRLTMLPLTVDFRFLPAGRGDLGDRRQRTVFYLGAGLGVNLWEYEEVGEFVDFGDPDLPIFFGDFDDSGAALETHVLAGIEIPVNPFWGMLFEARYSWSDDELDNSDFPDFGTLDLGGPSVYFGSSFRF